MRRRPRRNHSPEFKSKVAPTAVKGDKPLAELTATAFGGGQPTETPADLKAPHARIGKWTLENDFSEHALVKAGGLHARRVHASLVNWQPWSVLKVAGLP